MSHLTYNICRVLLMRPTLEIKYCPFLSLFVVISPSFCPLCPCCCEQGSLNNCAFQICIFTLVGFVCGGQEPVDATGLNAEREQDKLGLYALLTGEKGELYKCL